MSRSPETGRATATDGVRLAWRLWDGKGDLPRVALIHSLALDGGMWEGVARQLAGVARLLAVDLGGIDELRDVVVAAKRLEDTPPQHDLWPAVAAALPHAAARGWRVTLSLPQALAASVLLMAGLQPSTLLRSWNHSKIIDRRASPDGHAAIMKPPVLIVLHQQNSTPGRVGNYLRQRGYPLDIRKPCIGDPLPDTLTQHSGAVVFGGPQSANDNDDFIRREIDWMSVPLKENKPLLGICLGGQLVAKAAHATVTRADAPEIGWHPVELLPEAGDDPLFGRLPARIMAYQWHHYRFDLPGGAVPLATSDVCLQAFRLGERAWGLQFHCEVTAEMVELWTAACEAQPDHDEPGFDPARMRAETPQHIEQWNEVGREISSRFLAVAAQTRSVSKV